MQNEAEILNARLLESARLRQTNEGFRSRVPVVLSVERTPGMLSGMDVPVGMDQGMVRLASVAGRMFAHVNIEDADFDFDKEAGIGTAFLGAAKGVGKSVGSAYGSISRGIWGAGTRATNAIGAGVNKAVGALKSAPGNLQQKFMGAVNNLSTKATNLGNRISTGITRTGNRISGRIENFGQKIENAGLGVPAQKTPFSQMSAGQRQLAVDARAKRIQGTLNPPNKPATTPTSAHPAGSPKVPEAPTEPTGGQVQGPKPPPAAQPAGQVQPPAQQPAQQTAPPQGQVQSPQAPPAASQAQPQTQAAGQVQSPQATAQNPDAATAKEPGFLERAKLTDAQGNLDWGKVKRTAVGLGVAGLGAYGVYQAGKGLANALNKEDAPSRFNANAAHPAGGVNEYGYADRSVPYM